MKPILVAIALLASTLAAAAASAQEPVLTQTAPAHRARAGVQLELLPAGKLVFEGGGFDASADTAVAYGVTGTFDYDLLPWLSAGVAPRFVFNVIDDHAGDAEEARRELDLRARVAASTGLADKLRAYGFVAPGYSLVLAPNGDRLGTASGFVLAFGGGVSYDVAPDLYLVGELGYQVGFQSVDTGGLVVGASTEYLSVGIGAGKRF
jgi:hypothetical protein